jgi:TonB family protein
MNADHPSSFRKTLLLVIAAHAAVAAIPITWVSLGHKTAMVAAGPAPIKLEDVKWLDPALPVLPVVSEKSPEPEPSEVAVAEEVTVAQTPAPVKVVSAKPVAPRPQLGHVEKLPATKAKVSPPKQVNFHPEVAKETKAAAESPADSAPEAAVVESSASGMDVGTAQLEDALRDYHDRIQRVMESHWKQPSHAAAERAPVTKVSITISRDGVVSGVKLAASSGHPEVDRSALAAALAVEQIDPLPTAVRGDSYQLIIRFVLH